MPFFARRQNLAGIVLAAEHEGVGHPRHRRVGEALAAAVAGRLDAHQPGVQPVLDIALEDAVLDQHVALGRRALVVDGERAAAVADRAVVDHGDAGRRDPLADPAGESRRALAVEIALEAVADRLVQQHAGPAGAEHHRHLARRARRPIRGSPAPAPARCRSPGSRSPARTVRRRDSGRRGRDSRSRAGRSARRRSGR